jgi:hypothetical protein
MTTQTAGNVSVKVKRLIKDGASTRLCGVDTIPRKSNVSEKLRPQFENSFVVLL